MPGFDPREAEALVAIEAALQGPTPPLAVPPIPASWQRVFDSPVIGAFDNKWQLWRNTTEPARFAVVIRGTVTAAGSILADLMAAMIPASGSLTVDSVRFTYQFAADPKATVHLGFALAALILLYDPENGILAKLTALCPAGSEILVSGHSQGAAVATLCRSHLQYAGVTAASRWRYKTYVFAQPRPGNDHYAGDFEGITRETGFRVTNTQDWVPQVPLTFEFPSDLNEPNPLDILTAPERALVNVVQQAVRALHEHTATSRVAAQTAQTARLAAVLRAQRIAPTAVATVPLDLGVVWTFNFVNCGSPIVLAGTPGFNPIQRDDYFWQHHAAMYYGLLLKTFPSSGA